MEHYCTYNAPLIQRPFGSNTQVLMRRQRYTSVESLDAPITTEKGGEAFLLHRIQAQIPASLAGKDEAYFQARFSRLYDALKQLAPSQQKAITRFYGFFHQPASTVLELSTEWQVRTETIQANKRSGFRKLRQMLADALEDMLREDRKEEK